MPSDASEGFKPDTTYRPSGDVTVRDETPETIQGFFNGSNAQANNGNTGGGGHPGGGGGQHNAQQSNANNGGGGGGQTFNGFDIGSLMLSADGQIYGQRRVLSGDPHNPGQSIYGYETVPLGNINDINGISSASTIPVPALQQKILELQTQNAQTAKNANGRIIGQNPDGTYSYFDRAGMIQKTTDESQLAQVGIQPSEITQAKNDRAAGIRAAAQQGQFTVVGQNADGSVSLRDYNGTIQNVSAQDAATRPGVAASDLQRAQTDYLQGKRTQTQAGQYSVAGQNADGSLSVKDFYGNLQSVSAQQAAGMPGVTAADIQRAQSDYLQGKRTQTQAGQYEATTANPDGSIAVRDFYGNIQNVSAQQAAQMPGVSLGTVQYLQQQGNERNFQGAQFGFALPGQQPMAFAGTNQQAGMAAQSGAVAPTLPGQPAPAPPPMGSGSLVNYQNAPTTTPAPGAARSGAIPASPGQSLNDPVTGQQATGGNNQSGVAPAPAPVANVSTTPTRAVLPSSGAIQATGSGYGSGAGATVSGTGASTPFSGTNQQAGQYAQQGQNARTIAGFGQFQNLTANQAGSGYSAKNFLGQSVNLTGHQALASGSATQGELDAKQQEYAYQQRQTGTQMRAGMSHDLVGYDPNAVQSRVAGS